MIVILIILILVLFSFDFTKFRSQNAEMIEQNEKIIALLKEIKSK